MSAETGLVTVSHLGHGLPVARMRAVYRLDEVEKRLDKLPQREHESLRATYERMLEKGPERFQVKPGGLPAMEHLYDELPNFHEVLDDVRRQLALCQDSRDALELTPMLLLGPPGIGKTHFAREVAQLLGTMNAPITRLARALNGKTTELILILKQLSEKRGGN